MPTETSTIIALDVGARRIGVAKADSVARLATPFITLTHSPTIFDQLREIVSTHNVKALVVGLPRDINGQTTDQTRATLDFMSQLKSHFNLPIHLQDEAVTSKQAEAELKSRGKNYTVGSIDQLAATYILEDWLQAHKEATYA